MTDHPINAAGEDMVAVIMAGGTGTRFWPLSTANKPKQFLALFDNRSLLQKSFDRVVGIIPPERIMVLTNKAFVGMVREQLPELPPENVIGEPMRRDTAAAVCLGAVLCNRRFGNPVMAVLTADHLIEPVDVFQKSLLSAAREARRSDALYTFGIQPTFAATAYGYLKSGKKILDDDGVEHFLLGGFREKPDLKTAGEYVKSGLHYWNSGMFVWTVDSIMRELKTHVPEHVLNIGRAADFDRTPDWESAAEAAFEPLESISIDYAVMEKAKEIRCVASRFSWRDVGGWLALQEYLPADDAGNLVRGNVLGLDAENNLVFCENEEETVLLLGVQDLIVVRAGNRTLIVPKDRAEEVKTLVNKLR